MNFSPIWSISDTGARRLQSGMANMPRLVVEGAAATAARSGESFQREGRFAIVNIIGPLQRGEDIFMRVFGGTAYTNIIRGVNDAARDEKIDAILLSVNSPGGSVDGLSDAADAIKQARAVKPVIAQVMGEANSAAYYLASQAHEVYAHRGDMVGSVGTRLLLYDTSGAFADAGIEPVLTDTGPYKTIGADGVHITDEQKVELRHMVNVYFEDFVEHVKSGRRMSEEQVRAVATGRIYIGQEAVDAGLVDGIRSTADTVGAMSARSVAKSNRSARASGITRAVRISRILN